MDLTEADLTKFNCSAKILKQNTETLTPVLFSIKNSSSIFIYFALYQLNNDQGILYIIPAGIRHYLGVTTTSYDV